MKKLLKQLAISGFHLKNLKLELCQLIVHKTFKKLSYFLRDIEEIVKN